MVSWFGHNSEATVGRCWSVHSVHSYVYVFAKLCTIVIVNDVLSLVITVLIEKVVPLLASRVVD